MHLFSLGPTGPPLPSTGGIVIAIIVCVVIDYKINHIFPSLVLLSLSLFHSTTDDVEKSLELLDKVLSEFEEEHEVIHAHPVEPDSPSQGNQSEDDGYMSMNGRR